MDLHGNDDNKGRFVCPSDRQLALRAKLHTGWSSGKPNNSALDPDEKDAIIAVIQRNEQLEVAERLRVGKLVERVEKIKQRAAECGPRYCRLCGQSFGLLGPLKLICDDCQQPVCSKCSIDLHGKESGTREIWLCKICSETREMWKKTGAWFFKGIPRYELPQQRSPPTVCTTVREIRLRPEEKPIKLEIKSADSSSDDDDDDDEDEKDASGSGMASQDYDLLKEDTPKKFNITRGHPLYSRQISSQELQRQNGQTNLEWDTLSVASSIVTKRENGKPRRGSISSSWSMSESSSASTNNGQIGSNHSYTEPPLGWLEICLLYSESDHTLDCSLLRARDLPAMDSSGLADPFCKINIITEYGTTKQKKWIATKTVHKTKNPEFNESVRFLGVEPDELAGSILYVVVLDDDKYGHDFLGTAKILLGPIYNAGSRRMSIPLCSEDQHSIEAGLIGPWPFGQILLSLCYNTKKRSLVVQIKRCTNLMAKDNNGFSDPFIKIQFKPDSHKNKKYKTSIKWRNLNPIYNEEFYFEARPNDLDKQSLILTVWDKDIGKSNDFLGTLILGPNSKGKRLKQWKDCIRLPDYFHEQWHCLSGDHHGH